MGSCLSDRTCTLHSLVRVAWFPLNIIQHWEVALILVSQDLCSHEPVCIDSSQAEQRASWHMEVTHLKDELFFPSKLRSQHCLWLIVLGHIDFFSSVPQFLYVR